MEKEIVELAAGSYPLCRKPCLTLQIGASIRILARFDSPAYLKAFMLLNPKHDANVDVEALKEILNEKGG